METLAMDSNVDDEDTREIDDDIPSLITRSNVTYGIQDLEQESIPSYLQNPYKLPTNKNVARVLQEEKEKDRIEYKQRHKPLHKKTTKAFREGKLSSKVLRSISPVPLPQEPPKSPTNNIRNDPEFLKALSTGDKLRNTENISSFVKTKREMFLLQYMIGVKQDEVLKMEQYERDKLKHLGAAEKILEEDAIKFDIFLKKIDNDAVNAGKQADYETKVRLEKVAQIRKIHVQIASIKSEISKLEEILAEYKQYRKFLFNLAPSDWQKNMIELGEVKKKSKIKYSSQIVTKRQTSSEDKKHSTTSSKIREPGRQISRTRRSTLGIYGSHTSSIMSTRKRQQLQEKRDAEAQLLSDLESSSSTISLTMDDVFATASASGIFMQEDEDDELDKLPIYFTHPQQLLDIFLELEEMNIMLIQKHQETEEVLEEVQGNFNKIAESLGKEADILKHHIRSLDAQVQHEKKKADVYETISKMYSFGEFNEDIQEKMLQELNECVEEVYESIIGPNNVNLSTLQMMISIENKLEELLETIDNLPSTKVEAAGKLQDRQRRIHMRQMKLKEQQEQRLERMQKTLEKAMAIPHKVTGRRMVFRSAPPQQKTSIRHKKMQSKDEEKNYFFS